jgi:hypothetical protein
MTETEEKLIAALAMIGLSRMPNHGYSSPAATGTPTALPGRIGGMASHVAQRAAMDVFSLRDSGVGEIISPVIQEG